MKYLLFIILSGCHYTGVVVSKGCCPSVLEVEVANNWYVLPANTIDYYDSLNIGDTVMIDKRTLTIN